MHSSSFVNGFKSSFAPIMKPASYRYAETDTERRITQIRRVWFGLSLIGLTAATILALINMEYFVVTLATFAIAIQESLDPFASR
jgi:hypothetical protein